MAYRIFLDTILLPVTPGKLQIKTTNQNKTINLINQGEVNILKFQGLTEISFDFLVPQVDYYPFAEYQDNTFKDAQFFLDHLEKWKVSRKYFIFTCARETPGGKHLFHTNWPVSLEEYTINEDAKEGLDLVISVKLKQWRNYRHETVTPIEIAGETQLMVEQERPEGNPPSATSHTVVSGDTLWNIAKQYLGNGSRYMEIYNLNTDKISDPNRIFPGQVLVLPS